MAETQDFEGDSQMGDVTSPSSNSEDTMFPAANVDVNSAFPNDTQSLEGSLSSPPSSQRQGQQNDSVMDHAEEFETGKTDFGRSVEDRFAPGASWKNKKANDEWNRAWASVEDKSFSLKEFGDPFDDTSDERHMKRPQ